MDFVGEGGFVASHEIDLLTGNFVLTIKNLDEDTVIGTIQVEPYRVRALMAALSEIGRAAFPDGPGSDNRGYRQLYYKNDARARTEFLSI